VKRIYKQAAAVDEGEGFGVRLDGRPLHTPRKLRLSLPTAALARAVAAEWAAQGAEIRPETMPQTRLATTAIDRVRQARSDVVTTLTGYGATDLVCYHVDGDDALLAKQVRHWRPFRDWLARRHGIRLAATNGILHLAQAPEALAKLRRLVEAHDDFGLTALADLVTISGSLAIGLGLAEGAFELEPGWQAAFVDEMHQAEQWGEDAEAAARRARLKTELSEALAFLDLADARPPASP
jgi:chaperone required for assembly of F1-ATPase